MNTELLSGAYTLIQRVGNTYQAVEVVLPSKYDFWFLS